MTCDLQRANVWKRISAFLFDVILLAIACVLCAWGLSALLGFDAQYQTLMAHYQAAADACGLDMSIMTQTYSALTDAQRAESDEFAEEFCFSYGFFTRYQYNRVRNSA